MIKQMFSVFMMAIFIMSMPSIVQADFADEIKLFTSDNVAGDQFGISVFIEGDTAIAGANGDDDNGTSSGSAYVFVREPATGTWTEQQKLLASDGAASAMFGWFVSLNGDTAIVGGVNTNAAYVFVRDSGGVWTEQQKLLASDGATGDRFGRSASISGDTAIVGAARDADDGTYSGSAYVFVRDPGTGIWTEQQKLRASDGAAYKYFGTSVVVSGDTAIAGADGGGAYVFVRDPATGIWTEQQKLLPPGLGPNSKYGFATFISGDTAIVGASGSRAAYVYVYDPATTVWTEQQKLQSSDVVYYFGESVSISGDRAIVGASGGNAAYVFVRDPATGTWTEQQKLVSSDAMAYDNFGGSVSISGESAIVGAWRRDDNGTDSGSAYVYRESIATVPDITVTDSVAPDNDLEVSFGGITEGSFSDQTVTVTNNGDANLVLGDIAVADPLDTPFSILNDNCSAQTLTPAANCTLTVRFSPASTGFITDSFDIPSNDPIENPVTVSVSGAGIAVPAADITVTDSVAPVYDLQIPFGNVTEATTSDQTVTITNDGNADLVLGDLALADVLLAPFSILTDNCSSQTLTAAASCTVTVRFEPTTAGSFNDSFDIPSNDSDENPVTVSVSGTGTAVAAVSDITVTDSVTPVADLQVPFGDVTEATTSDQTVTVTNDGSGDLVLDNLAQTNQLAVPFSLLNDNCSGQTLVAAASCTLTVRFAPTATGVSNDSFDIPSNDPDENPITVNVSGTGTPTPVPDITITDSLAPVDDLQAPFGDVTEATTSDQTITISNDGNADLVMGDVATANLLAAPFSVQNDTCSAQTLTPSSSCTLTVRFAPTTTGVFNDSFDIPSNDLDEASVTFNLSGTGTSIPVADISVTDQVAPVNDLQIPFADLTVAGSSGQTVTITNEGNADLVIGNVAQANVLAEPFSVINDNCSGQTLATAVSCTLIIRFAPTVAGIFNDSFDVPSNDPDESTVTVNVSATGLAAGVNNPPSSPGLVSPVNGRQGLGTSVLLVWKPATDPDGDAVRYEVYNCTDSDPLNNCSPLIEVASLNPEQGAGVSYASLGLGSGFVLLVITFAGGLRNRRQTVFLVVAIVLSSLLASCSGDNDNNNNNKTYTVSGLDAETTYYWAIVAKDGNGGETPSVVWRYSTQ